MSELAAPGLVAWLGEQVGAKRVTRIAARRTSGRAADVEAVDVEGAVDVGAVALKLTTALEADADGIGARTSYRVVVLDGERQLASRTFRVDPLEDADVEVDPTNKGLLAHLMKFNIATLQVATGSASAAIASLRKENDHLEAELVRVRAEAAELTAKLRTLEREDRELAALERSSKAKADAITRAMDTAQLLAPHMAAKLLGHGAIASAGVRQLASRQFRESLSNETIAAMIAPLNDGQKILFLEALRELEGAPPTPAESQDTTPAQSQNGTGKAH